MPGPELTVTTVRRGAALLDEHYPGWEKYIDRGKLQVANPTRCILGQVYGYYQNGLHHLHISAFASVHYGFSRDIRNEWWELDAEWLRFLKERDQRV